MVYDQLVRAILKEQVTQPIVQAWNFLSDQAHQLGDQFSNYFTSDPRDPYLFAGAVALVTCIGVVSNLYVRHMDKKQDREAAEKASIRYEPPQHRP